jgi:hypothetical protein
VTLAAAPARASADEDALDEALRQVHAGEQRMGLSTHAPMVAEALCSLGEPAAAVKWIEHYRGPFGDVLPARERIDPEHWRAALGPRKGAATWEEEVPRFADWRDFLLEELAEASWCDVLDRWVARLAPGISAAATHGVIRTAHAARALGARVTDERKAELARGLAYWAAAYEELPTRAHSSRAKDFESALAQVPTFWKANGRGPGGRNIVEGLRRVAEVDGFADARDLVGAPDDVGAELSKLTAFFARVYLRHGTRHDSIAFVHSITGPTALRRIAPFVKPETAHAAFPYAWQAAAAIYCAYGRPEDEPRPIEPKLAPAELTARAVENGDDHAIKLTEVLLAEHALRPDPAYLVAAEDAVVRL